MTWRNLICLFALAALFPCARAEDQSNVDSVERDYSDELPRIPATEPHEALATFTVASGFRIELVAAEPLVTDPIALAFDEDGRMYVVEMRGYSEHGAEHLGRVRLLEDTDGDGRFDTSQIFADGLSWPTAIACYAGGVYVGAAPDILYLKDTDGDGKADVNTRVFEGFGRSNVQGLLNSFHWSLDNLIHGATSSSGASVKRVEEGESAPLVLRGRDFAFDPRTPRVEATSGGGQHGLSFNTWGEKFVCSNSDHLQLVLCEDRHLARNPYLAVAGARQSIAVDGPQADVFRASPVEPWRVVRTRLRKKGLVPGPVERGGMASGYFTSATGVTIYRGDAWPSTFMNWAIVGDVGGNLIHRKRLIADGLVYQAVRVDEQSEFVASSDVWFRPVQFANAPDGSLYVCDMYREVIEHPDSLPPVIKQHLDLDSGRDRGRIYRIVFDGFQQPIRPRLSQATSDELVALLSHSKGWHRETAARLIYERQDLSIVSSLVELASMQDVLAEGRIRALYALEGLSALTVDMVLSALADEHFRVRQHAVRLAESLSVAAPRVQSRLVAMTKDPSLHVRYQLAFALGAFEGIARERALAELLAKDGKNRLMRIAAQSSLARGAGSVLARLAGNAEFCELPYGRQILHDLAQQIGKQQREDDVAALIRVMPALAEKNESALESILLGLAAQEGSTLNAQITAAVGGKSQELLNELVARANRTIDSADASLEARIAAIETLRYGRFAQVGEVLAALNTPTQSVDVQKAAVETLAHFDVPQVASLLVERWAGLSPHLRGQAAGILLSRPQWTAVLLDAIEQNRIPASDIATSQWHALTHSAGGELAARAAALLQRHAGRPRDAVVREYQSVLDQAGDIVRGQTVFKESCAICHRLEGVGHDVGPNLAAMTNRGAAAILVNVLDPNREANPEFHSYNIITADGRTLTGIIAAETATSVTLTGADNVSTTVLRIDIDEMFSSGVSLMPEGLEKEVSRQEMADLLAYLMSL